MGIEKKSTHVPPHSSVSVQRSVQPTGGWRLKRISIKKSKLIFCVLLFRITSPDLVSPSIHPLCVLFVGRLDTKAINAPSRRSIEKDGKRVGWLVGWLDVSCSCSSSSGLIHIVLCLIVVAVFELTCRLVQSERKKKPRNDDIQSISGTFSIIFHLNLSLLLLWDQPSPALIPVDYLLHDLSMKSNKIIPLRRNMKKHPRQSFFTTTLNF